MGAHKSGKVVIGAFVELELRDYVDRLVHQRSLLNRSDGLRAIILEHQTKYSKKSDRKEALTPKKDAVRYNAYAVDWDEKYRPKTFDDMVGQSEVVNYYRKQKINDGKPKHAIFKGPPGVGKTSMAYVIENEFGVKMTNINGSADRNFTYFRDTLIPTMKVKPFKGNFRFIYIDETENIHNEAWMALKTPLEIYKHNTVVVFSCNDNKNIPDAIRSRCVVFDFTMISKFDSIKRLQYIAQNEHLEITTENLTAIADESNGDLRKAIMSLENNHKPAHLNVTWNEGVERAIGGRTKRDTFSTRRRRWRN